MKTGNKLRVFFGVLVGFGAHIACLFAALYSAVGFFGERAFERNTYQFTPTAALFYLMWGLIACIVWSYLTVRIGGKRSVKYLVLIAGLSLVYTVYAILFEPVTMHQREGPIDWQNLTELYTPSPLTDWGAVLTTPLGLFFGIKLVKPEQLEFEKVKIESNSNYPRDDYQN